MSIVFDSAVSAGGNVVFSSVNSGAAEAYALTDHEGPLPGGEEHPNSIMAGNKFATTGPVYFDISGSDPAIADPDWNYINDNQLWLTDIRDIPQFNAVAAGSVTYTIAYRVEDSGATGTFARTVDVTEAGATPDQFDLGSDVTEAEPGATIQRTFVLSGIEAGESVSVTATGIATASPSTAETGDTITVELTAGTFEAVVSGGASVGGVSDSFSVTTRAAVLPVLDTPIPDLSVTEGDAVSVDLSTYFSGATSYAISGIPAGSGLSFTGSTLSGTANAADVTASPYNLTATATNVDGDTSNVLSVTVVEVSTPAAPPIGVIDFSAPQMEQTSGKVFFAYSENDATGFEYSLDGAAPVSTWKTIELSPLTGETTYQLRVRAVNGAGAGEWFTLNIRTSGEPPAPGTDNWPFSKGIRHAAIETWTWGSRHPKTGMRVRIYK